MPGNTFGKFLRITTFGESHGPGLGVVMDGCPAGHRLDHDKIQSWLDRRRPGQNKLTSPRQEADRVEFISGTENLMTLGTPLTMLVRNQDARPQDYQELQKVYRPSHADFTTEAKYGLRPQSGGGRASARETIGRVAAAAVIEQILATLTPQLNVVAFVDSMKDIRLNIDLPRCAYDRDTVDASEVRCPDPATSAAMQQLIEDTKQQGDSLGGTIACVIRGCPVGLGEPVFDKLQADLAKAMLSLPATKGFEIGSGFGCSLLFGSEHNDAFYVDDNRQVRTRTNFSGGIQGGISNGEVIYFRVAFKPPATIQKPQQSVNTQKESTVLENVAGRHDPCVLPRAVPMVEAMALLVIADHFFRQQSQRQFAGPDARN